jgi:stage II sporulation protein D
VRRRRASSASCSTSPDDVAFSGATSACGEASIRRGYSARRVGRSVQLRDAGKPLANCGRQLRAAGNGIVEIDGAAYRGALEVVPTDSEPHSLNAIDAVAVDQYVKGVVPNESPASWPQVALRAQALAARSFASPRPSTATASISTDTRSQVYEGIASEEPAPSRAAAAHPRPGSDISRRDRPDLLLRLLGGHTESVENVFFGPPVPYLIGVTDPFDGACPLHSWTLRFSQAQIDARLGGY